MILMGKMSIKIRKLDKTEMEFSRENTNCVTDLDLGFGLRSLVGFLRKDIVDT